MNGPVKGTLPFFLAGCALFTSCAVFSGCSTRPKLTDSQQAKVILQTALDAWKAGKSLDEMKQLRPPIYVGDERWQRGKKLEDFKIKSDGDFLETSVTFPVALKLTGEPKARDVVYSVSTNPAQTVTLAE